MERKQIITASGELGEALNRAWEIFREDRSASVEIHLENRYYRLEETLKITMEKGPGAEGSLKFVASPNARPRIGSAVQVGNWAPVREAAIPAEINLTEEQRNVLMVAEAPEKAGYIHTMFKGDSILPRGKSVELEPRVTKADCLRSFNVAREEDRKLLRQVPAPRSALESIRQSEDLEILFTAVPWQLSILPVEKFDLEKELVLTREEGTVPAFRKIHEASWLENQPEFIKGPGEWAYDSSSNLIFYYPEDGENLDQICVPLLKELVLVEGEIDYEGSEDKPLSNVHFDGITFLHGKRDTKDRGTKARGLQHDWEFFDRANSLLRFRGARNCTVRNCRFTASGGVGIRSDLYGQGIVIENNEIDYVGSMGILLCGYGPGTKDVNRGNVVRNNLIHHTGEIYHHGHAVFLWQSGNNLISHNTIHHVPRKAVGVAGIRLPLLELRHVTWDDSSLLIRWNEIDEATGGKGLEITEKIGANPHISDSLRSELWEMYMPFLHGRNNRIEYNNVYRALDKLGDGAVINISGAGEGNLVYRNYVHHIRTNQASGVLRTDDWQSGTTFQENVLYMANVSGIVRKNMTHLINNYLIDVTTKQMVRFASYPDEQSSPGALIIKNIFFDSESPFVLFNEGYTSPGMVHPSDTTSDFNLIWNPLDPAYADKVLAHNREKSLDGNSLVSDPLFMDFHGGDFRLEPDSPAHGLGILSIDVGEMGIGEDFPEYLKEFDDDPGTGDKSLYHRGRGSGKEEYLFW